VSSVPGVREGRSALFGSADIHSFDPHLVPVRTAHATPLLLLFLDPRLEHACSGQVEMLGGCRCSGDLVSIGDAANDVWVRREPRDSALGPRPESIRCEVSV
jgi:hypothetical protein